MDEAEKEEAERLKAENNSSGQDGQ